MVKELVPSGETLDGAVVRLIRAFNDCFLDEYNTCLQAGDTEPVYIPANADTSYHQIIFAHGFFASALHEVAHWCIAGSYRRTLVDYGYWYAPDGRDAAQQAEFEQVEVKPQALEWLFACACRQKFRISVDNLNGASTNPKPFMEAVYQQVLQYCETGLPKRAAQFHQALIHAFQPDYQLSKTIFCLEDLYL